MTWDELFELAAEHEATVADVTATLRERRDE
jgi:hypothetical protein